MSTKGVLARLNRPVPSPMIVGSSNQIRFSSNYSYPNSSCFSNLLLGWIKKSNNVITNKPTVKYLIAYPVLALKSLRVYSSLSVQTEHAISKPMKFKNSPASLPLLSEVVLSLGHIGDTVALNFYARHSSSGQDCLSDTHSGQRPTMNNK